jgi:hypothetical protein
MNVNLETIFWEKIAVVEAHVLSCSGLIKTKDDFKFIANILKERMSYLFSLTLLFRGSRDGFSNDKFH